MPDFADTAAYLEAKAKKARSPERRQEFREAANLYRMLHRIVPMLPPGYKERTPGKLQGSLRADRLSRRAEECRTLAATMKDPDCRATLTRLADTYEQAAASSRD